MNRAPVDETDPGCDWCECATASVRVFIGRLRLCVDCFQQVYPLADGNAITGQASPEVQR